MSDVPDIPILTQFEEVADPTRYVAIPDDWQIGIADIEDSSGAIASGEYKSVNFAGAATISAVTNAIDEKLTLFSFGGDGAHFVVRPDQVAAASKALGQVSNWIAGELGHNLRVGMVSVADIHKAGYDVRAAYWQASRSVQYALFTGGGLEWSEQQLKSGNLSLGGEPPAGIPDLTGLSCQWGPVQSTRGKVMSLIVKPGKSTAAQFDKFVRKIVSDLDGAGAVNPVPETGPELKWPAKSLELQSRTKPRETGRLSRRFKTIAEAAFFWLVFRFSARIKGFEPDQYRADIAANIDYQKFNDGLMMTLDCTEQAIETLRKDLDKAASKGIIKYGLHVQDEALITCVVPSVYDRSHMHFIDGSDGGYAAAARQLRSSEE